MDVQPFFEGPSWSWWPPRNTWSEGSSRWCVLFWGELWAEVVCLPAVYNGWSAQTSNCKQLSPQAQETKDQLVLVLCPSLLVILVLMVQGDQKDLLEKWLVVQGHVQAMHFTTFGTWIVLYTRTLVVFCVCVCVCVQYAGDINTLGLVLFTAIKFSIIISYRI